MEYKAQRKSTRTKSSASTDHHYSPNSQQDDASPSELLQLCQEFHQREVNVTPQQRSYIEHHTKRQSEDSLWHHQHKLRLTASNFGRVAKRHSTTPVGNLVKSLLYSKPFSTEATRWGTQHEDDAKKQYLEYLKSSGYPAASIKESVLVIDDDCPSLACSPDGLVDIPGEEGGIVEMKCPFVAAKEGMDPVSASVHFDDVLLQSWCHRKFGAQTKTRLLLPGARNDGHNETVLVRFRCLVTEGDARRTYKV